MEDATKETSAPATPETHDAMEEHVTALEDTNTPQTGSLARLKSCTLETNNQTVPAPFEATFNDEQPHGAALPLEGIPEVKEDVQCGAYGEGENNNNNNNNDSVELRGEAEKEEVDVGCSEECEEEFSSGGDDASAAEEEGGETKRARRGKSRRSRKSDGGDAYNPIAESEYKAISKDVINCVWGNTFLQASSSVEKDLLPPELLEPMERRRVFITSSQARRLKALRAAQMIQEKDDTHVQFEANVDLPQVTLPILHNTLRVEGDGFGKANKSVDSASDKTEYHGSNRCDTDSDDEVDGAGQQGEKSSEQIGHAVGEAQLPLISGCGSHPQVPGADANGAPSSTLHPKPPCSNTFPCSVAEDNAGAGGNPVDGGTRVLPFSFFTMVPIKDKQRDVVPGSRNSASLSKPRLSTQAGRRMSRRLSEVPPPSARYPTPPRQDGGALPQKSATSTLYASAAEKLRSQNGIWEEMYEIIEETRDSVLYAEAMEASGEMIE
ncbi:T. brucei spp.-specific protein [Trypanosoma brucei gambiense DAL972]|uniref:T. brucei spp.-specific protein n=2 Tax=Trypanosoma brucei TaxID=5691 RepID=Q57U48_TRYB2|nr:T. brucei spp.-specific protein [Trypanosoma brucei gambiense DAL972]XP_847622.1 hypothetical protein Tb927.8.7970 [Trypanosoma brucei brucei TREU927]AAX70870.1 hypothetical protein Tb927.8.7970 [Trypanosoma brucei]AAZ13556.1 hypothetical protein Tb927.8.7970 [Trypanosoma brucei brucei TREU927]CBH13885.1 T. brucei spp.-specific protein [Trypanosoma brucei gambiense DAL972]|eukprot:XP_011776161.1 T. brucei spp.-specific protein [Trypanosoma brucei gambiense DAL972]